MNAEGELTITLTSGAISNLSGPIEAERVEEHGKLIIEQPVGSIRSLIARFSAGNAIKQPYKPSSRLCFGRL